MGFKTEERILASSKKYAAKAGYKINPEEEVVGPVVSGLALNEEKYGKRYCPCRAVTGNEQEDKKTICPCVFHKQEIKQIGCCKCRLFCKK